MTRTPSFFLGADMRASNERLSRAVRGRDLYLMPTRRLRLERHIPAGRTLHLVDIENLVCGANATRAGVREAVHAYRRIAPVSAQDHIIVGCGPTLLIEAGLAWCGARLVLGRGVDGADNALLSHAADHQWIAEHFDRVVLGSGDGIFADTLASFRRQGVAIGVVGLSGHISWRLRSSAHFVRTLDTECHALGAA